MIEIIRNNKFYFIIYCITFLIGLGVSVSIEKGEGIAWLNRHRTAFFDLFFTYGTTLGEWVVFVIGLVALLFVKFKKALFVPLLGLIVSIVSYLMKSFFYRPRPVLYFNQNGGMDALDTAGFFHFASGHTSFPSGHTMAGFAIFTYLILCINNRWWQFILLILAMIVGVSRMYLIHHFLEDVVFGSLVGVFLGTIIYWIQDASFRKSAFWNRAIPVRRRNKSQIA